MAHRCHAIGCGCTISPKMLMCRTHWDMVPSSLQKQVWGCYRPGQEIDKNPSKQYLEAAEKAIQSVAQCTVV